MECCPLPIPERGGKVETLRLFLNVTASDFTLVVAYLLSALYPKGPYPILILYGVQAAANTAFLRKLRKLLVDPHVVGTSAIPASSRDLFISAHNSLVQAYENVSKLSDAMSDALCRLATGDKVNVTSEAFQTTCPPLAYLRITDEARGSEQLMELMDGSMFFALPVSGFAALHHGPPDLVDALYGEIERRHDGRLHDCVISGQFGQGAARRPDKYVRM